MTAEPGRALRADARRNRARLLAAAEAVFAEHGVGASTEEVARAAGVGIGTLFRHFPTKEALLTAVYQERLRRLTDDAWARTEAADAGAEFFEFFRETVLHSERKLAIIDALAQAGVDVPALAAGSWGGLSEALRTLLIRAQEARAVRGDIGLGDVIAMLLGASRAVQHATTEPARTRAVMIVMDGMRPPA
jgi:AcrR family transcriptional regulator